MANRLCLLMVKHMHDKRGFTLLELLICLAVICSLSLLALSSYRPISFDAEYFVLESLVLQLDAMVQRQSKSNRINGIDIAYNLYGHPSHCNTYHFQRNNVIVHLGWGKISVH